MAMMSRFDSQGRADTANRLLARREEFAVRRRYLHRAPFAFALYCLRYWKRMHGLRRAGST